MLTGRFTKGVLPCIREGCEMEDRNSGDYEENLPRAQMEIGTLQWLAIKTRPDISAATSILASLTTRCPTEVMRLVGGVWKYLASTWDETLNYQMKEEHQSSFLVEGSYKLSLITLVG